MLDNNITIRYLVLTYGLLPVSAWPPVNQDKDNPPVLSASQVRGANMHWHAIQIQYEGENVILAPGNTWRMTYFSDA